MGKPRFTLFEAIVALTLSATAFGIGRLVGLQARDQVICAIVGLIGLLALILDRAMR